MKAKRQRIRDLLGLTQEQLAILLHVKHSQLALNELGHRKLPAAAVLALAEMLEVVKATDVSTLMELRAAEEAEKHNVILQKLLDENRLKQWRLSRILLPLEKKYQSNLTALYLVQNLMVKWELTTPHQMEYLGFLKSKIGEGLAQNSYSKIEQYKIKLKVLQQEEKLLREEIGRNK